MAIATGTLIGLENYLNNDAKSIFDLMELPDSIDKVTLENSILLDVGDYEPLWYDPYFFRDMVGIWSKKWYRTFEKWARALSIEYEPLENYDRREEWEEVTSDTSKMNGVINGNSTINNSSNSKNNVSAYNSADYSPSDENVSTGSQTDVNNSTSNSTTTNASNNKRSGRAHGNIGVTTSQQMLQSELDVASWNLYEHITDIFAKEFLLMC